MVGEEAAMPGQPVALARVVWNVPRQFTLENRRLPLACLRGGPEVGRRGRSDCVYSTGQAEMGRVSTFGERAQVEPTLKLLS